MTNECGKKDKYLRCLRCALPPMLLLLLQTSFFIRSTWLVTCRQTTLSAFQYVLYAVALILLNTTAIGLSKEMQESLKSDTVKQSDEYAHFCRAGRVDMAVVN